MENSIKIPSSEKIKMTGWISVKDENEKSFLESLGIKLGEYQSFKEVGVDDYVGTFEGVELNENAFKQLEKHQDRFTYDLKTPQNWEALKRHRTRG